MGRYNSGRSSLACSVSQQPLRRCLPVVCMRARRDLSCTRAVIAKHYVKNEVEPQAPPDAACQRRHCSCIGHRRPSAVRSGRSTSALQRSADLGGRLRVYLPASGNFRRGFPTRSHGSCQDSSRSPSLHRPEPPRPYTPSSSDPLETARLDPRPTSTRPQLLRHPCRQGPAEPAARLMVAWA